MQRYELGNNRESASKLYAVAQALQTPLACFSKDCRMKRVSSRAGGPPIDGLLGMPGGIELMQLFPQVTAKNRRPVLNLVQALAEDETSS